MPPNPSVMSVFQQKHAQVFNTVQPFWNSEQFNPTMIPQIKISLSQLEIGSFEIQIMLGL